MNVKNRCGPATFYRHIDHDVKNANELFYSSRTFGQRVADSISRIVGSWPFIIIQSILLVVWVAVNVFVGFEYATNASYFNAWDPYPFILLNLVLSFQAAYTGPIVLMSQNRQAGKDRIDAEQNYATTRRAEEELHVIMEHLAHHDEMLFTIIDALKANSK